MFGEEESESPRLPSPWRNLSSSASSTSPSPLFLSTPSSSLPGTPEDDSPRLPRVRRSASIDTLLSAGLEHDFDGLSLAHGLVMQAKHEVPQGIQTIGPEVDKKGHIEYKLKLPTPTTPHRLARLVTQLKWRIVEGGGCAVYELGVLDSGTLVGLRRAEMQETLDTLRLMLSHLGGGHIRISRVVLLGGPTISTPDSEDSDSSSSSSTANLGFKSFDVSSTAIEPDYPGTAPIPIKPSNGPPHPERSPQERAAIKRAKRDARRMHQQEGNEINPVVAAAAAAVAVKSRSTTDALAYGVGAVRHPRTESPCCLDSTRSARPVHIPRIKKPWAQQQQQQQGSLMVKKKKKSKKVITPSPSEDSPYRPRRAVDDDGVERFVIEAVVMKRQVGIPQHRRSDSSDEGPDLSSATGTTSGDESFNGGAGEGMFGAVDEEEEGWRFLAFDSLPRVRRSSGLESTPVEAW